MDNYSGRVAITVGATALLLGLGAMLGLGLREASRFKKEFQENPPEGRLAYSVKNQIHVVDVSDTADNEFSAEKFQIGKGIEDLLWINDKEIVYSAQAGRGWDLKTPPSHGLYKLDVPSATITNLFNPYDSRSSSFLGDIKVLEEQQDKEKEDFIARAESNNNSYVVSWTPIVKIKDLGYDKGSSKVFMHMGDEWYSINTDGSDFQKPVVIPDTVQIDQRDGPRGYKATANFMDGLNIYGEKGIGYHRVDRKGRNPAWLHK